MRNMKMALCEGRHEIPQATDGAIFPNSIDPLNTDWMHAHAKEILAECDALDLYVTGLTVALVEVIRVCVENSIDLVLYHFDRVSGAYYPQRF